MTSTSVERTIELLRKAKDNHDVATLVLLNSNKKMLVEYYTDTLHEVYMRAVTAAFNYRVTIVADILKPTLRHDVNLPDLIDISFDKINIYTGFYRDGMLVWFGLSYFRNLMHQRQASPRLKRLIAYVNRWSSRIEVRVTYYTKDKTMLTKATYHKKYIRKIINQIVDYYTNENSFISGKKQEEV